jgi:hypothetical protein
MSGLTQTFRRFGAYHTSKSLVRTIEYRSSTRYEHVKIGVNALEAQAWKEKM